MTEDKDVDDYIDVAYLKDLDMSKYFKYSSTIFFSVLFASILLNIMQYNGSTFLITDIGIVGEYHSKNLFKSIDPYSPAGYFVHNSSILLSTWIGGFSVIFPFFIMYQNGMSIGGYIADAIVTGDVESLAFIVPHGIFEIPAILIGGAVSIYISETAVRAAVGEKKVDYWGAVDATLPWVVVSIILLLVAAVVESWYSPEFAEMIGGMIQ